LVFIFCFTSFGVVLILGGPQFATLEVAIYEQAVVYFDLPVAAALAIIQIIFTFLLMWSYTITQTRMARPTRLVTAESSARPIRTRRDQLFVGGNLLFMVLLLGLPLGALILRSFTGPDGLWLRYYTGLFANERGSVFFVPPIEAVRNSVLVAFATMTTAVCLGLISALFISQDGANWLTRRLRRFLDPVFMLPLATSAVTLGFGYIITFNRPPLRLADSLLIMPLAHTLVAMPFVIRAVLPALRSLSANLREAAAVLGASPGRVWREIDWPLIRPAVVVGAVFAFTISMGEFGASLFLARPDFPTMPVAIYRFLGQPGPLNYGQALAMSCLLMLVCAIGFVAIERFRLGDEGEF
jgi:thiamine transport system permease protein